MSGMNFHRRCEACGSAHTCSEPPPPPSRMTREQAIAEAKKIWSSSSMMSSAECMVRIIEKLGLVKFAEPKPTPTPPSSQEVLAKGLGSGGWADIVLDVLKEAGYKIVRD